jgi:hypothetical protein
MRLRSVAAVGVGGLTGLCLGLLVSAILSSAWADESAGADRPPTARFRQSSEALPTPVIAGSRSRGPLDSLPTPVSLLVSFGSAAVGGYVAARIARRAPVLHGTLSAWPIPALAIALAAFVTSALHTPPDVDATEVAELALYPIAGAMGGVVRRWRSADGGADEEQPVPWA